VAREILIERMTWTEVQKALDDGFDTVLIVTGSMEQHGPHLPMANDTILGYAVGEKVARLLGNALLAPVIQPGLSEHHMAFRGTITLSPETFPAVVMDYAHSLARHGFRRLVLLWSHGGDAPAVNALAPQLAEAFPETEIYYEADITSMFYALMPVAGAAEIDIETMGIHAGEMETSIMRNVVPDQVRLDQVEQGFMGNLVNSREEQARLFNEGLLCLTKNGILGDATISDLGRGEQYLDAWASYLVSNLVKA
jgi:creatinine amidohydrolase